MGNKHEYWKFEFITDNDERAKGPANATWEEHVVNIPLEIDMGRPVTKRQITAYIHKRYETTQPVKVWPHTPWWME